MRIMRLLCLLVLVPGVSFGEVTVSTTAEASDITLAWPGHDITRIELISFDGSKVELRAVDAPGHDHRLTLNVVDGGLRLVFDGTTPEEPDDPDDPEVPDGHRGLTAWAYKWATELVDIDRDPDKVAHAAAQAANYAKIAAGLVSVPPEWSSVSDAFAALKLLNQGVLPEGTVRDAWAEFGRRISKEISAIWDEEPFGTKEASCILEAIGKGLEAVK